MGLKQIIKKYFKLDFSQKANIGSRVSAVCNAITTLAKVVMGIFTSSIFLFISAMYSCGCGIGRFVYIIGTKNCKTDEEKLNCYVNIATILFTSSILYIIYMIRLFFIPSNVYYPMFVGIGLAAISTWEMFWAIRGLVKSHKRQDYLLLGLKSISLATALLSIVLTQTAILSFTLPDEDCSLYNAISGTLFGSICVLISLVMFSKYKKDMKKIKNE